MFISDFAIKRPIVTTVVMLALAVFGIFALTLLNTDEFPDVQNPVVVVSVPYPGASPESVEREVIDRIEEGIAGISGVDKIQSNSLDGYGVIITFFQFEKDLQEATQEIRDKISEIRNELPPEMEEPILTRFNPADLPIMSLVLSSTKMKGAELTRLADPDITRRLRGIPGVAEVEVVGGIERELTVELRPRDLQSAGLSVSQVVQALQSQNLAAPVGRLNGQFEERTIRLLGRLEKPADFARLPIAQSEGRVIRLGDVADARDGTEEPRSAAVFNGEEAVGLDVKKAKGFSTTQVAAAIREQVEQVQATLPQGVTFHVVRDAGTRVAASVRNVEEALVEGAALTVLVVFLFLNSWRSTVITGLALPVSVLASFVAVLAFGFTLNTMSLLGLSLAIGILIDDAIVVRENIVRHVEMGKDHYTAAHEGTNEIGLAVAATTFSIVVVFVPIAFMGGIAEQWFAPFALTIACSVLVSLFVSFSLDPMLSAYWPDPHVPPEQRFFITRWLDRFNAWFDRQADRYKAVIGWALDHRWKMVMLAVASFVGALALPALGIVGGEFFPVTDESEFNISLDTPPGSNLEYTKVKAEEAARIARSKPEVIYSYTTIGGQTGSVDEGTIYVRLKPKHERERSQNDVAAGLRAELARLAGATASITTSGFGDQKQILIQVMGRDSRELQKVADQVLALVQKVPGAVDVDQSTRGQKPELEVQLDRALAGSIGVTAGQVAQALRPAFAGIDVGDWVDPAGETRDVTVRFAPEARTRTADLATLPLTVPGPDGRAAGAARPARDHPHRPRPGAHRSSRSRAGDHGAGEHREPAAQRGDQGHQRAAGGHHAAAGRDDPPGRGDRGSGGGVRAHHRGAGGGDPADVPGAGHPVRIVPRSAGDHDLAAAVADRRHAGAARHRLDAEPDEPDRRHPADGHRGQERDPADRLRQVGGRERQAAARGADRGRPRPAAPDPDDDLRADRRHDSGRHRRRRRGRLPRAARPRGDRRRDHVDAADAAGDPDVLRDHDRLARLAGGAAARPRSRSPTAPAPAHGSAHARDPSRIRRSLIHESCSSVFPHPNPDIATSPEGWDSRLGMAIRD